ncbi:MAG: hypothetical protein IK115_07470 [Lachnospiraceae bacterium]|nr:hypothetical protein [Lachnospiraceae bacterium]
MKRRITCTLVLFTLLSAFCLGGCSSYVSSGVGTIMISNNLSDSASVSFDSFEGTKVFTLKNKNGTRGEVSYHAKLGSGSATVYYDVNGTKTEWFKVEEGDELEASQILSDEGKIYIIVETDGKCEDGRFEFNLE